MKRIKYKVSRGNMSHQCKWIVLIPRSTRPDVVIAEFWNYKDARSFCSFKNNSERVKQL